MAQADIDETHSRLKEMTLTDNLLETVSQGNRNAINLKSAVEKSSSAFTFDNVIGHLEDMLIDDDFHKLQSSFLEKYWEEFENNEENKHCYMAIFNEYTNKIEDFISQYLKQKITDFDMEVFTTELKQRKNTLEGELFEVLLTLSDFTAFKEIFLDYRAMKEGRTIDLSASLSVTPVQY